MFRTRGKIKRWHKAFVWALLAEVAKAAALAAKAAGGAALKGAALVGKGAIGAVKLGAKGIGAVGKGILDPAEAAFNAFKKGGAEAGLKAVGKELIKSTDIAKKIDLIKSVGDFILPEAQGANPPGVNAPAQSPTDVINTSITGQSIDPSTFNKAFIDKAVGLNPDLSTSGRFANLGGTLADVLRSKIGAPVKGVSTQTETRRYHSELVFLANKGIENYESSDWDILRDKYPYRTSQIDKLQLEYTPVKTNPEFENVGGVQAWASKNKAKVTPRAQSMIDAIKSQADLEDYKKGYRRRVKSGSWKQTDHNILAEYYGIGKK